MRQSQMISRKTREGLIERARQMRQSPTPAEALLWRTLRNKKLAGYKFRRQHIIHIFIVDFYCPVKKLIIEIDGSVHDQQIEYDRIRTKDLQAMGYQVLRFSNEAVLEETPQVLETILLALSDEKKV